MKIGFIGMGNMGQALLRGMLKYTQPANIRFTRKSSGDEPIIFSNGVVNRVQNNEELVKFSDIIILAVKPQMYADVFSEISACMSQDKIVISLAPGKTIDYISGCLGTDKVVRAMPNTPAKIGYGMTGIAYNESFFSDGEIEEINGIFSSIGEFEKVDESLISAVVCASGSSPAYVYEFISKLAKACESKGLSENASVKFVANAVLGAAKMVLDSDESPDELKVKVCSKGGTTIAGLEKLGEYGFGQAIMQATDACYNRSEELSNI